MAIHDLVALDNGTIVVGCQCNAQVPPCRQPIAVDVREAANRSEARIRVGFRLDGAAGLAERSRLRQSSPRRGAPVLEAAVLVLRQESSGLGAREIARVLEREDGPKVAPSSVCAAQRCRTGAQAAPCPTP